MKKESEDHFNEDNIGFQIPNENNEINDNNDGEETLGYINHNCFIMFALSPRFFINEYSKKYV